MTRKPSEEELVKRLTRRPDQRPPEGLAERIRAEIPDPLAVGGAALRAGGATAAETRAASYRPFMLIAASLLVVVGVGFVAARLLRPPDDLAREIALSGVTVIDDIVVTVPPRPAAETAGGAAPAPGQPSDGAQAPPHAPAPPADEAEAVTVVVRRSDGGPCQGATVKLERSGGDAPWRRMAETDRNGVAFFLGVPVGTYTLSTGFSDARPAVLEMLQVTRRTVTRIDLRVARPGRT